MGPEHAIQFSYAVGLATCKKFQQNDKKLRRKYEFALIPLLSAHLHNFKYFFLRMPYSTVCKHKVSLPF